MDKTLPTKTIQEIQKELYVLASESIEENYFFGFKQLTELALKALSPGINDPGTAIQSLRSLFQLYAYRINAFPENTLKNSDMQVKIILKELSFEQIFEQTIFPIWDYGKHDRLVQNEVRHLLQTFLRISPSSRIAATLLQEVKQQMIKSLSREK